MVQASDFYDWHTARWAVRLGEVWYQIGLTIINDRPVISILDNKEPEKIFPLKEIFVR